MWAGIDKFTRDYKLYYATSLDKRNMADSQNVRGRQLSSGVHMSSSF